MAAAAAAAASGGAGAMVAASGGGASSAGASGGAGGEGGDGGGAGGAVAVSFEGGDVTFVSSDGERFTVPRAVAFMSKYAQTMVGEETAAVEVEVPEVTARVLAKVLEFCTARVGKPPMEDFERPLKSADVDAVLSAEDAAFVNLPPNDVCVLALAASFMDVEQLSEITSVKVACLIKACKTGAEVREVFGIPNEFTPEEEAKVLDENKWTEE